MVTSTRPSLPASLRNLKNHLRGCAPRGPNNPGRVRPLARLRPSLFVESTGRGVRRNIYDELYVRHMPPVPEAQKRERKLPHLPLLGKLPIMNGLVHFRKARGQVFIRSSVSI